MAEVVSMFDSPLEAYFDESGTHDDSDIVTVAGFLSTRNRWQLFDREWREFLQIEGITKGLHRTELETFRGEFKRENGWDERRRSRVLSKAERLIEKHVMWGSSHSVIKSDYVLAMSNVEEGVKVKMGRTAYIYCGKRAIWQIANWAELLGHYEGIDYFLESGGGSGELAMVMQQAIKKGIFAKAISRCAGIHILPKYDKWDHNVLFRGRVQFQAADLLAYEGFRLMQSLRQGRAKPESSLISLEHIGRIQHIHHVTEEFDFMVKCWKRGTVPF